MVIIGKTTPEQRPNISQIKLYLRMQHCIPGYYICQNIKRLIQGKHLHLNYDCIGCHENHVTEKIRKTDDTFERIVHFFPSFILITCYLVSDGWLYSKYLLASLI